MSRNILKEEERKMLQDAVTTQIKKENFIREIQNGLGEEIITQPHIIPKKLSFIEKLKKLF